LGFKFALLAIFFFAAAVSPLLLHGSAWGDLSLGVCEMLYRKERRRLSKGEGKLVIEAKKKKGAVKRRSFRSKSMVGFWRDG
jgi:hypothetical protein